MRDEERMWVDSANGNGETVSLWVRDLQVEVDLVVVFSELGFLWGLLVRVFWLDWTRDNPVPTENDISLQFFDKSINIFSS